jgi:hypothetical protein
MVYSVGAVERAMTIHQALLHALHGRQTWLQVADVIGLTRRALAMARPIPGFPTPGPDTRSFQPRSVELC